MIWNEAEGGGVGTMVSEESGGGGGGRKAERDRGCERQREMLLQTLGGQELGI